jgi:chitinase
MQWYLKNFAIAAIGLVVDYIVFMTYDLHGQWDYDHPYSDTGCPGGDCLRSHVNLTETISALSMITKAGVPSNKVVVGVTSYGRSFQMTTAGCTGKDCTYTGPLSGAYGGPCTQTPGYIANAEIAGIIAKNGTVVAADGTILDVTGSIQLFQDDSFSNIVVYDDTQWIAYMDDDNKATRTAVYAAYNLGGTTDWAVDLQTFDGDVASDSTGGSVVYVDPSIWTSDDHSITCEPPCVIVLPPYPLGITSTVVWPALTTTLMSSSAGSTYTVTTTISVPAFPISEIDFQPITLGPTDTSTYEIMPVQSIMPPSFIFTLPPFEATFFPTPISTKGGQATATTTSSGSVVPIPLPPVVFYTTPVPIIIQPQPTEYVSFPPQPKPIPHVTVSKGSPKPQCKSGCGHRNCGLFGCGGGSHCGLFGCGGGCGIFGCGGGCGIFVSYSQSNMLARRTGVGQVSGVPRPKFTIPHSVDCSVLI